MELLEVARDVYACLQPDRGLGWSNSGLVSTGGGLVVDTFWDLPRTRELIAAYATVLDRPAGRLINTHHNGDHCWGNQLFEGAEIIGHRLMAEGMRRETAPEVFAALLDADDVPAALSGFRDALAQFDFSGIERTPPTTLVDDLMQWDLDGLAVEAIYVGPAHTSSDMIVHVPERGVVFAGDILFHKCTPVGWDGTYERWMAALDRIVELAPEVVVPGHGPLADVDGVREFAAYLEYVHAEARTAFDAGLTALEAAKRIELGRFAGWTEPERLVLNVHRAYRELRGDPPDAPVDMTDLFSQVGALARHYAASRG